MENFITFRNNFNIGFEILIFNIIFWFDVIHRFYMLYFHISIVYV